VKITVLSAPSSARALIAAIAFSGAHLPLLNGTPSTASGSAVTSKPFASNSCSAHPAARSAGSSACSPPMSSSSSSNDGGV